MTSTPVSAFGYCERLADGFWAEPLNALSNGGFLVAACLGFALWRRSGGRDPATFVLVGLVFAIGIGSFLFHTMPRRWTLLADVVPIQLFAFGYFGFALRRFFAWPWLASALGTAAFAIAAVALSAGLGPLLPAATRGSAGYGAFALALFGVGLALLARAGARPRALAMLTAGLVFSLSLALRSLDGLACGAVPFGLHWAWHLLNALVLFLLLRAAIAKSG